MMAKSRPRYDVGSGGAPRAGAGLSKVQRDVIKQVSLLAARHQWQMLVDYLAESAARVAQQIEVEVPQVAAGVYGNLAVALQALKRYEEAAPLHQKAHALFTEVGHATGMDLAAKNLGVCQANMPRLPTPQQGSSLTGDGVSRDELLRQPDSPSVEESGVTPEELPEPWVGHGRPVQRVHRAHGAVYGSTRLAEAFAPQHDGKGSDASVPRQKRTPAER